MFVSSFCSKPLIWVTVSFPSLLVPCIFFFISLCVAFTSSSILCPYSIISVSILITMFWTLHLIGCLCPRHLVLSLDFWSVFSFGPYFFVSVHWLCCKGWSLRYLPGWGNPLCCIVALYVEEGSEREQCHLLISRPMFSHCPKANWALLVLRSQVGGLVYVLGPHGCLQWTLLWGWEFLLLPQPPQVFSIRGFEALVSCTGSLGCAVCLTPQLLLLAYLHTNVGPPTPPATASPGQPAAALPQVLSTLAAYLHPSYWSGWMFLL